MYAEVIPNFRLPQELEILDYEVPEDLTQVIQPGFLVNIPFRNRTIEGLVYRIKQHTNLQGKILPIKSAILPFAPFKQRDLNLLDRISEYYFVSKPMVLKAFLPGVPQRGADKPGEQRMRRNGFAFKLRVKLNGNKPRMSAQFKDFHQVPIRGGAGGDKPGFLEGLAVFIIKLEAVPVAFGNRRCPVDLGGQ